MSGDLKKKKTCMYENEMFVYSTEQKHSLYFKICIQLAWSSAAVVAGTLSSAFCCKRREIPRVKMDDELDGKICR